MSNSEVVTAWADGCTWTEALQISGLPPGDLARILSRALDALRQLGNLPYTPVRRKSFSSPGIHPDIRNLCRDAARKINRYPVKDPLFVVSDDVDDDEIIEEDDFDDDEKSDASGDDVVQ